MLCYLKVKNENNCPFTKAVHSSLKTPLLHINVWDFSPVKTVKLEHSFRLVEWSRGAIWSFSRLRFTDIDNYSNGHSGIGHFIFRQNCWKIFKLQLFLLSFLITSYTLRHIWSRYYLSSCVAVVQLLLVTNISILFLRTHLHVRLHGLTLRKREHHAKELMGLYIIYLTLSSLDVNYICSKK